MNIEMYYAIFRPPPHQLKIKEGERIGLINEHESTEDNN